MANGSGVNASFFQTLLADLADDGELNQYNHAASVARGIQQGKFTPDQLGMLGMSAPSTNGMGADGRQNFITQARPSANDANMTPSDSQQQAPKPWETVSSDYWSGPVGGVDVAKNQGMTGLNDEDFRLFQSQRQELVNNAYDGRIDQDEFNQEWMRLLNNFGVDPVVQGTDKTYFLDPGLPGANPYSTNIKGVFGDDPALAGMYRRHAKTEGEGFFGQFDEANTIGPLVAAIAGSAMGLGPVAAGLLTGGTSLATGNEWEQALFQGVGSGLLSATAPTMPSLASMDPNVIMNMAPAARQALYNKAAQEGTNQLLGSLGAFAANEIGNELGAPNISWQLPDVSDQLGDVQVQVPDFSRPIEQEGSGSPVVPSPSEPSQGGPTGPAAPDEDPFGTAGDQPGGPGALDEPNEPSEDEVTDLYDLFGNIWNGMDGDGHLVTDPGISIIDGELVTTETQAPPMNGMSPNGDQFQPGEFPGSGTGTGGQGGQGPGSVSQPTGMLGFSPPEYEGFMASLDYVAPILQELNIPLQDYVSRWMTK